jgi:hypothetical protein
LRSLKTVLRPEIAPVYGALAPVRRLRDRSTAAPRAASGAAATLAAGALLP